MTTPLVHRARGAAASLALVGALIGGMAVAVGAPTLSAAAAQEDAATEGEALVRVVHASPDAPAIDVYVDDAVVVQNLAFGAASEFLTVADGERQVRVVPTGTDPAAGSVIDEKPEFDDGGAYVVAAVGLLAEIEAKVYDVNLDAFEEEGRARVRVVHAAPGVDDVDVAVAAGDTLFEGVGFGDGSDYTEVEAGTYDLEVRTGDEVALAAPDVALVAGQVYEVFAIGQIADGSLRLLPLVAPATVPCSALVGVGTSTDACLRAVHAAPDAPSVDIYVDDSVVAEAVAFGTATGYLNVPGGEHRIRIVPTGAPADDAVVELTDDFDEGRPYVIVAAGTEDGVEGNVYDLDLGPLASASARVRVIHAAADAGDVDVVVTGGPTLYEGVAFGDATDYAVIDAATYDLEARSSESEDVAVAVQGLMLDGGMVYDVVALGSVEAGTLQLLPLVTPAIATGDAAVGTPAPAAVATPVTSPTPVATTPPAAPAAATVIGTPVP